MTRLGSALASPCCYFAMPWLGHTTVEPSSAGTFLRPPPSLPRLAPMPKPASVATVRACARATLACAPAAGPARRPSPSRPSRPASPALPAPPSASASPARRRRTRSRRQPRQRRRRRQMGGAPAAEAQRGRPTLPGRSTRWSWCGPVGQRRAEGEDREVQGAIGNIGAQVIVPQDWPHRPGRPLPT